MIIEGFLNVSVENLLGYFSHPFRYAGEAGDVALAMIAARHFWNACLPFIGSSADRQQLKIPTEVLLKSIMKASEAKNKQVINSSTIIYCQQLLFHDMC